MANINGLHPLTKRLVEALANPRTLEEAWEVADRYLWLADLTSASAEVVDVEVQQGSLTDGLWPNEQTATVASEELYTPKEL